MNQAVINALYTKADRHVGQKANELRNIIVDSLSKAGTGRVYVRKGIAHQASAPGQPPAIDTGTYAQSWVANRVEPLTWKVSTHIEYGPHLEFGTKDMEPRPHVRPAIEEFKAKQ